MIAMFQNFLHGLSALVMLAGLGGLVGFGCAIVTRLVTGLQGYFIAAAAGAVMMVGANLGGVFSQMHSDADAQKIADLQAEKAKMEHDAQALADIRAEEDKLLAEQTARAADTQAQMDKIAAVIEKHKADNDKCAVGAFADELDAIRGLK